MNDTELLVTIAEVSVAFAGFASLASIIGQRFSREQLDLDVVRLRGMLETSLIAVVFSLLPLLPPQFGASQTATWRFASLVFVLVAVLRIYVSFPRSRLPGASRMFAGTMLAAQVVVVGLLLTVVLGVAPGPGSALYQAALFVYLCLAAMLFLRLAVSLLVSQRPAA